MFKPMGIDTHVFNPIPDDKETATLSYYTRGDICLGQYYKQTNMVGAAGWISSVTQLGKLLTGLRNNSVLNEDITAQMFNQSLGWDTYNGLYGQYYHHGGAFGDDPHGIRTVIMRLSHGYDCVLVANSATEFLGLPQVWDLVIQAFEAKGVQSSET